MRSGSTLLKALMAAAPDISSLPETNFQKFQSATAASEIASLCDERIVVLKRPAWFNETKRYPKLPNVPNAKRVIIARDVHTTTASLRKMVFRKVESWAPRSIDNWFANKYWAPVYANLLDRFPDDGTSNFGYATKISSRNPSSGQANSFGFWARTGLRGLTRIRHLKDTTGNGVATTGETKSKV